MCFFEHAHQNDLYKANFYQTEFRFDVRKSLVSVPNTVITAPISLFEKQGVDFFDQSSGDLKAGRPHHKFEPY